MAAVPETDGQKFGRFQREDDSMTARCTRARDAQRPKLAALQDEFRLRALSQSGSTMKSVEWARLPTMTRVVFLLMAGVDGESETLAVRAWKEFNLPEQAAIESSMRQLRAALIGAQALCRS